MKGLLPGWLISCRKSGQPFIWRHVVRWARAAARRVKPSSPRSDWFSFMVSIMLRMLCMPS